MPSGEKAQTPAWSQTSPLGKTGLIKQGPFLVTELPFQFARFGSWGQKQPSLSPKPHSKLTAHPLAPSRAQARHLPPSTFSSQRFENPSKSKHLLWSTC